MCGNSLDVYTELENLNFRGLNRPHVFIRKNSTWNFEYQPVGVYLTTEDPVNETFSYPKV